MRAFSRWCPNICPNCQKTFKGFDERFQCVCCDGDTFLQLIGEISGLHRGNCRTPGGQWATSKVMIEHEGKETSYHNILYEAYRFVRLGDNSVITPDFCKTMISRLKHPRSIAAINANKLEPPYTSAMRDEHLELLRTALVATQQPVPEVAITKVLTAELIEWAYINALISDQLKFMNADVNSSAAIYLVWS
jgi:hypothetical protein